MFGVCFIYDYNMITCIAVLNSGYELISEIYLTMHEYSVNPCGHHLMLKIEVG